MNRETIEKAAYNYTLNNKEGVKDFYELNAKEEIARTAFIAGAEWRINSVWHDRTASCEARRKALVLFKNGNAAIYKDLRDLSYERLWGEVERFAYIDDLIPERKEEVE